MINASINYNNMCLENYRGLGGNQSNGALMRCMPLILYTRNLTILKNPKLFEIIKCDAMLTHYNNVVWFCIGCYVVCGIYLLNNPALNNNDNNNNNENKRNLKAIEMSKKWLFQYIYYKDENTMDDKNKPQTFNDAYTQSIQKK